MTLIKQLREIHDRFRDGHGAAYEAPERDAEGEAFRTKLEDEQLEFLRLVEFQIDMIRRKANALRFAHVFSEDEDRELELDIVDVNQTLSSIISYSPYASECELFRERSRLRDLLGRYGFLREAVWGDS